MSGSEPEWRQSDLVNADRLRRAASLLREALQDDPRLSGADVEDAAAIVERAARLFFESDGGKLTVEDWIIKQGLSVGETVYDIEVVVQAKDKGKGKVLAAVPGRGVPEDLEIRAPQRALAGFSPGDLALASGELCRQYGGKKREYYLDVDSGIEKCGSSARSEAEDRGPENV